MTFVFQSDQIAHALKQDISDNQRIEVLETVAQQLVAHTQSILEANQKDLQKMDVHDPKYDRLQLTSQRIADMAKDVVNVAHLPSPLGKTLYEYDIQPSLHLEKITVPLGVVCMIYEARPNVTVDAFTLCFKSGNACVLKGGKEAHHTNQALMDIIHHALQMHQLSHHFATYLAIERHEMHTLLTARHIIDVIIPRGSHQLIQYVRQHATVPVIETGAGVVHAYIDQECDIDIATKVVLNAKTRRVSVCNALDCVLIHKDRLVDLPIILQPLQEKKVTVYADDTAFNACHPSMNTDREFIKHASPDMDGHEFLDYKLLVKTVDHLDQAIDYINQHGSKHSDAIISNNIDAIQRFQKEVDASTIYVNASTAFTDGAQFGLGAEIGISTQKLHVRGPMGLDALVTTKYLVNGMGHVR